MRKIYYILVSNTRSSEGMSTEKKLKFFAAIILVLCVVTLIATRGSLPEFLSFLLK